MLKKPLFWIIAIIVIVVLWFVFGTKKNPSTAPLSHSPAATQPAAQHAAPAAQPAAPAAPAHTGS